VATKQVRGTLVGLALALAFGGGMLVAFLGSDGRLGYTEPRGNPSATPRIQDDRLGAGFSLAAAGQRRTAPGFTFTDKTGRSLRLADFHGRVVLVNMWATWCPPCIAEMPDLDALQQRLGGESFQVTAVSLDRGGLDQAARWLERNKLHALTPYAADPAQFSNALLPTSLLLDREGRVAWHGTGLRDWTSAEAEAAIRALLAE